MIIVNQYQHNVLEVVVQDTGVGIDKSVIKKLGKPFNTFDN